MYRNYRQHQRKPGIIGGEMTKKEILERLKNIIEDCKKFDQTGVIFNYYKGLLSAKRKLQEIIILNEEE